MNNFKQIIDLIFYEELKQIAKKHNYNFNYDLTIFKQATMVMENFSASSNINLDSIPEENREIVLKCSEDIAHLMLHRQ